MKLIEENKDLYHLYIKDKDIWLSRRDIIELRLLLNNRLM